VSGVSPAEGDVSVGESNQPVVGDGDAVGVGAEIAQHVFWTTEGRLGIDHPVLAEQYSEPGCEGSWFGEWSESAVELDPGFAESILECGDELTAEHTTEHFDGKKKGVVGGDPASVVRSEAASGDYAVHEDDAAV
jgi:hypothetical protein